MDGIARAFYNVCRHRGTRLVEEAAGTKLRSIVWPYHSWTYTPEGRLVGAPHTESLVGFDKEESGLFEVRLELWGGFVWANLHPQAAPLRDELGSFFAKFDRFPLDKLRLASHKAYEVDANWKILVENYQECYHCAPVHPDLNRITPYFSGEVHDYFFDPKTMARPDFDASDAVDLWDLINRQDWAVCQRSQKGMGSRVWKGGRYSDQEPQVYDFDRYVMERLGMS